MRGARILEALECGLIGVAVREATGADMTVRRRRLETSATTLCYATIGYVSEACVATATVLWVGEAAWYRAESRERMVDWLIRRGVHVGGVSIDARTRGVARTLTSHDRHGSVTIRERIYLDELIGAIERGGTA